MAIAHHEFLEDLDGAISDELYDAGGFEMLRRDVAAGHREMPRQIKLQPVFARRLAVSDWGSEIIARVLDEQISQLGGEA